MMTRRHHVRLLLHLVTLVCVGSLVAVSLGVSATADAQGGDRQLDPADYADRLRAMWLGQTIANWTGLTTEAVRTTPPFYTDEDWGIDQGVSWKQNDVIDFVFQDPWLADDDTDIEYVYLHLLDQYETNLLTASQIAAGWQQHINDWIWVSNRQARDLIDVGALPPVTGMPSANPYSLQIDAQLTTEIFGALAPGMPAQALQMANLPILTTASGYAAHAAQFNVLLYALAAQVDRTLSPREQVVWLVQAARQYIPDTSKTAGIVDFVLDDYLSNPDAGDWERTRDRVYERYHLHANEYGFVYRDWTESSVNFACGLIALLYGELDFRRTVQIGTLSGWDSDNGTATMGGLLGLLLGYEALAAQFPDEVLSDRYQISRTRENLPDYLPEDRRAEDTFTQMAERMLPIVARTIHEAGGTATGGVWILPENTEGALLQYNPLAELSASSANYRASQGDGSVTVSVGGDPALGRTRAIVDGAEHDFSGIEVLRPARAYQARVRDGQVAVTVTYDPPVEASVIRFIEGDSGGFEGFALEFLIEGDWQPAPAGTSLSPAPDPAIPYQSFDFVLPESLVISGVRLVGEVDAGPLGAVTILELDALSSRMALGNLVLP